MGIQPFAARGGQSGQWAAPRAKKGDPLALWTLRRLYRLTRWECEGKVMIGEEDAYGTL